MNNLEHFLLILKEEYEWHINDLLDGDEEYVRGFLAGLEQAQYLLTLFICTIEEGVTDEGIT